MFYFVYNTNIICIVNYIIYLFYVGRNYMINKKLVKDVVNYFNINHSTVRETAKEFGISKSTVHLYLTKICPNSTSAKILAKNKAERHIRGGQATKNKYLKERSQ